MGIMITYHGYNNGHANPVYNVQKTVGVHHTQHNMVNPLNCSLKWGDWFLGGG